MPETRSTAHEEEAEGAPQQSAPQQDTSQAAGAKRKADDSQGAEDVKSQKVESQTKQMTLEESVSKSEQEKDADMEEAEAPRQEDNQNDKPKGEEANGVESASKDTTANCKPSEDAIQRSPERKEIMPTNILEKGIIYFFFRPRVGVDNPESVGDLQRTFFVLRPLPKDAKIGDGALPDSKTNRLLALPKKAFPKSHSDRFMAFVEKGQVSMAELKESFFGGEKYDTKTAGTRQTHPITPVAEGVYAITSSQDRSTHLAYMLTIPTELSEVQKDLGLRAKGSFVTSVKNPTRSGPASASLPQGPGFPKEIIDDFRGLAWAEVRPHWLDYANAQILLIGERNNDADDLGKAVEVKEKDRKEGKEEPREELEKLEHEDELRIHHLNGNDSIFDDLKISSQDYPKVPSTW